MPARRGLETHPRNYLASDGIWPDGPLTEDAPDEARFVMSVGQRLKAHCEANSLSMNAVARVTNVPVQTVSNLLSGKSWGDVPIIWRLEAGLGADLWCGKAHGGER